MKIRELHRLLGITLLLPFIAWSATAVFFLVRPAYDEAYAPLAIRQYAVEHPVSIVPAPDWREFRYFRSILGEHLLVRRDGGWMHLDPLTLQEAPYPDNARLRLLVEDAISANATRYGSLAELDGRSISTDTGVTIGLDWAALAFTQQGRDTRNINRIYSIHYLEWTGIAAIDKFLGLFGLFLLMYITWTGTRLAFGWGRGSRPAPAAAALQKAG